MTRLTQPSACRAISALTRCLALLLLCVAWVPAVSAQDQVPELNNLIHQRHTHKHNSPHPTVQDGARFRTDRTSPVVLPLPTEQDAFSFVVFGDRTGGPASGVNVLADAVRDTNLIEPDLVMTVGDLINGYNQDAGWLAEMREFKGIMSELLCPWFPVAGNHDVYWRGPEGQKPNGEHEANYEMHFGPLWYAFEHKNSWFIVLYSDEGDPQTGEKNFRRPESQRMSEEQFNWLDSTLSHASDAKHIFLFLHHPRWLKGGYGDDWDKVHDRLVEAGNVTAVFAGHIHRMRYDGPQDGIEYVTLATVGGGQRGLSPQAGYLHHFNIVTVRDEQVAMAAVPVGQVMDVRDITGQLSDEVGQLAQSGVVVDSSLVLAPDGQVSDEFAVAISNPTSRDVEVMLAPHSADSRWWFMPDHAHTTLAPGDTQRMVIRVDRMGGQTIDRAFALPELSVRLDYLTEGFRYAVPEKMVAVPLKVELNQPQRPATERALRTGENAVAAVESAQIQHPDGPFTLECWMRADSFADRVGLIAKTQGSEYGFFVSGGTPGYIVHLGGRYINATAEQVTLNPGQWYHLAGVYDGTQVRLFLDGQIVSQTQGSGPRTTNALPLMIGADVDQNSQIDSPFDGVIDSVRLSTGAVYTEPFSPQRELEPQPETLLLFNMDAVQGPFLYDASGKGAHATVRGATIVEP